MGRKNNNLKAPGAESEFGPEQISELRKCALDPIYFIKNYVWIQHPTKGAVKFELYPYQEKMIRSYMDNRYTIVLSARQTGKSVTSAAYLLWYAIFNFDKTVLIASNKNANAMEMIFRIRYMYEELPHWLKPGVLDDGWNKHNIGFDNKSRIVSTATSEDSGRGMSISLLFLDEFAFVAPGIQDEFWTSISPTLSTGGSCIMTSTPNGDANIYAELWRGAVVEANEFHAIRVKWDEPPGRDEEFKQREIGQIGIRRWNQEYECQFLSSDALLLDSEWLLREDVRLRNLLPKRIIKQVSFWSDIRPGGTYLVGVDPSTGSGEDFSVITIYDFPTLRQVGEWRSNTMSTNGLYSVLKNILIYLESQRASIYFSVENNGVGEGVIALYEADENPPEISEFISEEGANRRGLTTTSRSKLRACVNLKEMLEKGTMHLTSPMLLSELKAYVRNKGSYAAQAGSTDDCVSASLIIVRLVEEISTYEQAAFDKLYASEDFQKWSDKDYDGYEGGYDDSDEGMPMVF